MSQAPQSNQQQSSNSQHVGEEIGLQSRLLQKASFNSQQLSLTLTFHSGAELTYWPIYQQTWDAFQISPSKGSFYIHNIKGKANVIHQINVMKAPKQKRAKTHE